MKAKSLLIRFVQFSTVLILMALNTEIGNSVTKSTTATAPSGLRIGKNPIEVWSKSAADAQESIWVATYKLKSQTALGALITAQKRGVEVRLVVDGKEAKHVESLVEEAVQAGLEVSYWPSDFLGSLHAKFYIFDQKKVIFGSFNLTNAAEKSNVELLYISEEAQVVSEFCNQWHNVFDASLPVNPSEPGE